MMTEADEASRRSEEIGSRTQLFMEALDVDEMIAQLLCGRRFCKH